MNRYEPVWYEAHHGPGPFAWLVFALLVVAVAGLIVIAARWLLAGRPAHAGTPVPSGLPASSGGVEEALQVARLRYARGEMARDQYLQLLEDLVGPTPPPPPPTTAT
jgi:uncharacterized membrane protein